MANPATRLRGEFVLLGVFGLFLAVYLWDVHDLPMEGKILSYVLAPALIVLLLICAGQAVRGRRKSAAMGDLLPSAREADSEQPVEADAARPGGPGARGALGLGRTIVLGLLLYLSIFLLGFYWGTGLFLLIWFAVFRRLGVTTLVIAAATPLLLYTVFEYVMLFGLYEGILIRLLQR